MQVIIEGVEYSPKAKVEMKPMTFGGLLKSVRNALDMTLDKACVEIGCSKSGLWELENDRSEPSFRLAKKISAAYGVELITLASYLTPNVKLRGSPASGRVPLERRVRRAYTTRSTNRRTELKKL